MMEDEKPKYDVAISFLYQDLALAQALYDELSKNLEVFFFPRNQEELAGSEGLESMREPFRHQSRINLVLYRPKWGKTPWTGVEEAAVKESCLATSYRSIFFFVIEPTTEIPTWLPETHVRFNYADFSLEQAVGAVKARVQERGGHFHPMTPRKKVELLRIEEEYQRDRRQLSSHEGARRIFENVELLFREIGAQLEAVNRGSRLNIQQQMSLRFGEVSQVSCLGAERVGLTIAWVQRYTNDLDEHSGLYVREINAHGIVPPGHMRFHEPDVINEAKYDPDLSRTREYVWKLSWGESAFISSKDLATNLILQFLDLIARDRAGEIERDGW